MKKLKAYTLMEVMVVMIIMIILLGLAFSSYSSFIETTKFNEDVSTIEHDILIIQRASMLLERGEDEDWIYGLVIDFGDIQNGQGQYQFYKWCSEYSDYGSSETRSEYPSYVDESTDDGILPAINNNFSECTEGAEMLVPLSGYGYGDLNLEDDVVIPYFDVGATNYVQYLVFESVSGRAFLYDAEGTRIDPDDYLEEIDLEIIFNKNYGKYKTLVVKNLTGRTKVIDYEQSE